MSTFILAVLGLILLIGPGLVVIALDVLDVLFGAETYTISTRDLPNTAPSLISDRTAEPAVIGTAPSTGTGMRP